MKKIEAEIRDRFSKLQWRVDAERKINKKPTQACIKNTQHDVEQGAR